MSGSKVPRDPNMPPEVRRFLDDLARVENIFDGLDATAATALLNVFTSALKGLAPASGGGTTNFLRADGSWAAPPAETYTGPTHVGTASGSGASVSFTGIPSCKMILVVFDGISHDNGANQTLRVALDADNGASYGTPVDITSAISNAILVTGQMLIARANQSSRFPLIGAPPASGLIATQDDAATGPVNAIQFTWSAGNFDAGDIDVYAL